MENLIPLINKLMDVTTSVGAGNIFNLNLPQIVVVGSQSTGKSSVLEALVGRGFLPRGSGIVTRRPLVLKLVREDAGEDWAVFQHKPQVRFTNFDRVRQEIVDETDRLTGHEKGISRIPINLTVHSPRVVDLTLVDLPGITRVPVGDQPDNIEELIRDMCMEYISQDNAIILAVTAANTDISTSDAIQMARRVDPQGLRTLGVITKLDLMDKGTDAYDVLNGSAIPLKLGYVGVVCRSQHDIDSNTTMEETVKHEEEFFARHPRYCNIADRLGTRYLAKMLNRVLLNHIQMSLPALRERIAQMLTEARKDVAKYTNTLLADDSKSSRSGLLLHLLNKFAEGFKESLQGQNNETEGGALSRSGKGIRINTAPKKGKPGALSEEENDLLFGGAKLRSIFEDQFRDVIDSIGTYYKLDDETIGTLIFNSSGTHRPLFVPEVAFESLSRRQIELFREPALECVENVYDAMKRIFEALEVKELSQFPLLVQEVNESVLRLMDKNREPTRQMVSDLIDIELAYINTSHPDFIGADQAVQLASERVERIRADPNYGKPRRPDPPPQERKRRAEVDREAVARKQEEEAKEEARMEGGAKVKCFMCGKMIDNDPVAVNKHVDECLKLQEQAERERKAKEEAQKKQGGWWPFGGGKQSEPEKKEKEKEKPEPPPKPKKEEKPQEPSQQPQQKKKNPPPPPQHPKEDPSRRPQLRPMNDSNTTTASKYSTIAMTGKSEPQFNIELIKVMLESYYGIVRKNVKDTVPKSIMTFLIVQTAEMLSNHLIEEIFTEGNSERLLSESEETVRKRNAAKRNLEILENANRIVNEVRESARESQF